jgi:hypothetical protein
MTLTMSSGCHERPTGFRPFDTTSVVPIDTFDCAPPAPTGNALFVSHDVKALSSDGKLLYYIAGADVVRAINLASGVSSTLPSLPIMSETLGYR